MNKLYTYLITMLTLIVSIGVSAQDIPTGLVRLKSARTSWYLSTANKGAATTTANSPTKIDQVWVLEPSGTTYSLRSANTGEYLQAAYATPAAAKQALYIRKSPNATASKALFNISSKSDFSGSFLNTNTGHGLFTYSMDEGCDWYIEQATNFTEDDVRQRFAEMSGFTGTLAEGKYYRIISYYGRAMTDGSDITTREIDADNFSQYWRLIAHDGKWRIQNALSEKLITQQSSQSTPFHSVPLSYLEQFPNLQVDANINPVEDKWEYKWTINFGTDSRGLHDASTQGHNVVSWSTAADASVWSFQECEVDEAALALARGGQAAYDDLVANKAAYQAHLDALFADKACTTLNADIAALSDDALAANADYAALTDELKAMVMKVKNDTWQQFTNTATGYSAGYEKFFRIYDYQVYSNYSEMANNDNTGTGNQYGRLSGPTGIVANAGDVIYIFCQSAAKSGCTLSLEAVGTEGVAGNHATGELTTLRAGMNLFQFNEQKMLYIFHQLNQTNKKLADYPAITVHIEGGQLNGYWDATRGMTNADWKLLQQDLLKAPFVNLKTKNLVFQMDTPLVTAAEPNEMEGLMRIWDMIAENENSYMGLEDLEGKFNNIWNCFSGASSYMHATTYGTWYSEGTIPTIMNYKNMTSGGNLWGPSHEMGHNRQAAINVIGTTESSNNLFSNINTFEQGITASRRQGPTQLFEEMAKGTVWLQRDIWLTTSMFYQLYLYFHVQHHDDQFLPNLFRKMRKTPLEKPATASGTTDYLRLARAICDVAKADMSEFFEAYGMFVPANKVTVEDYGTYVVTTTQSQINTAKKAMQKYEKKLGNIMFIDDRVITHPAIADNIFEGKPNASGNRVAFNNEDINTFLMKTANSTYVGGDYTLFTDDAQPSDDDYYVLTNAKKTIEFKGTNYAGHKFYDADGNFIYATHLRKITLPKCVTDIGMDNITVMTANYDMTDTPCTDTKPDRSAVRDIRTGQVLTGQEVYDLTGRRVSDVRRSGMYIVRGKKVFVK